MEKGEQLRCPPSPRYASVKSIAVTEPQTISCPHARCAMDRIGLHADIDPIPLVRDVPAICLHAPDTILALEPGANVEQAVARHSEVGQPAEERTRLCPEGRSEEHTSELQSLMRISYAVFCLKKKTTYNKAINTHKNSTKRE